MVSRPPSTPPSCFLAPGTTTPPPPPPPTPPWCHQHRKNNSKWLLLSTGLRWLGWISSYSSYTDLLEEGGGLGWGEGVDVWLAGWILKISIRDFLSTQYFVEYLNIFSPSILYSSRNIAKYNLNPNLNSEREREREREREMGDWMDEIDLIRWRVGGFNKLDRVFLV